jgi:branched-chain amino acid transport system substrate-binding protein
VEARRLVEQVGVDVLIGPLAGSQEAALQAYARRHPATTFVNGTASAHLGDPAPNFFSFHPTGAQWMAGLGRYAYHDLGWRTAVTVGGSTTDIFTWSQMAGFAAEFCALGGRISERVWLRPGDPSAVLAQVPRADVDGFVVAASPEVVLALVNGSPALRGNLSRRLILGTTAVLPELSALGERTRGVAFAVGGGIPLPTAAGYKEALRSAFPGLGGYKTGGLFDVFYYDAMIATLSALDAVGGDLSDGQRRLRAALAGLALALPNGRTTLDGEHQAIAPNHLQQLTGRGIRSRVFRTIPAVERTFGGLLDGIVPSANTPVCRKGDPPPWARG